MSCSSRAPIEEVKWRRWQRPGSSTACLATVCFPPPGQRWAPAALWTLQFSLLSRSASRFCYTLSASRRLSRASGTLRSCLLNRTSLKLTKQVIACKHAQAGDIFFHSTLDDFLFSLPLLLSVVSDDRNSVWPLLHPAAELHIKYAKVRLLQDDSCFHGYLPIIANLVLLSL